MITGSQDLAHDWLVNVIAILGESQSSCLLNKLCYGPFFIEYEVVLHGTWAAVLDHEVAVYLIDLL